MSRDVPPIGIQPVRRQTTSQRVAAALRTYIDENLEPGDRLPPERSLCQMLGVGRTTVREALRSLQSQGRVTVRAGSGAYVTVPGETTPFAHWPEQLEASVEDLLQVRLLLEPAAAALAASTDRPQSEKEAVLRPSLETMAAATSADELERRVNADLAFHQAVARLAGNAVLLTALEQMSVLLVESRRVSLSYERRLSRVQAAHGAICDAIVAGDPARAAMEMAAHLVGFGADMGIGRAALAVPSWPMRVMTVDELVAATDEARGEDDDESS